MLSLFEVLSFFFFSSRRRHTRCLSDWSSDVCSSDLIPTDPFTGRNDTWKTDTEDVPISDQAGPGLVDVHSGSEIGRASCRERVEILVGAGSSKKKKKRYTAERMRIGTKKP